MSLNSGTATASAIAAAVRERAVSAVSVMAAALERIETINPKVNAFTDITATRAMAAASALDSDLAEGRDVGPLAGVPFAVKNLIDLEGLPTRAGAKINRDHGAAARDGALVRRLESAGAICVGALNMGEYAYDFTGENVHDGASRNPHALDHMSGGSSGGSGAAVAAGLVPIALGSDTNGSIRVPSAFCGTFGLKPTFGRLTRAGSFPFIGCLDHLGPFARCVSDLALCYDAMQGADPEDPSVVDMPPDGVTARIDDGVRGLRIAIAGGYFARGATSDARMAVRRVADALDCRSEVELAEAARARAAAYVITAAEGAALHLERLRTRADDFDPDTRDRLLAGAMIPAGWVERAHRFRRVFQQQVRAIFETVDIILAPSTPCRALAIGQKTFDFEGVSIPARANIGLFTQPISFLGLPVVAVPVWLDAGLPLGVQVIAAPWREDHALRVARALEKAEVVRAPVAAL